EAPWPVDSPKSTGAAEMSTSTIEARGRAWGRLAAEAEFPPDNQGTATPQPHRASEAIQEQIRGVSYKKITPQQTSKFIT
ncbi:hypothetical protein ACVGV3_00800, partial [Enterobacter intestinihominis]